MASHGNRSGVRRHQPRRKMDHAGKSVQQILALYPPNKTEPMQVLEVLIDLFNKNHTAKQKEVSFKTRRERAEFLRRFFGDLRERCGDVGLPDPRNLTHRHVQAVVTVWKADNLAPATIQTYFSFLRGFAAWIGKPGLVRKPADYGLTLAQYQRHEASNIDKSWSGHNIDIATMLTAICQYDRHIGMMMRLMRSFGLRKKEAIMLRPHQCKVPFEQTRLSPEARRADYYLSILAGSKGGRQRYIPLDSPERLDVLAQAQALVTDQEGHMGHPGSSLKQVMRRFDYVMLKFGVTNKALGVTAHGLRHEALIEEYRKHAGANPPVKGGAPTQRVIDREARQAVANLAGHSRKRVTVAYCGSASIKRQSISSRTTEQDKTGEK